MGSSALAAENNQLKETVQGLERERDFYFSKLRDIELLVQQAIDVDPKIEEDEEGLVKQIQAILYSTEVGTLIWWYIAEHADQRLRMDLRFQPKPKEGRMTWRHSDRYERRWGR